MNIPAILLATEEYVDCNLPANKTNDVCTKINPGNYVKNHDLGWTNQGTNASNLNNDIVNIVNVIIGVLGIVAVAVIILGGITYMTSNGDAKKVQKGKDIILYGVIGLIIVILSAAIVNFVIAKVAG